MVFLILVNTGAYEIRTCFTLFILNTYELVVLISSLRSDYKDMKSLKWQETFSFISFS